MNSITFDQLPAEVLGLKQELQNFKEQLLAMFASVEVTETESPIDIIKVSELTGLTKPTLYGYVQRNEIPFYKKGNRLYFFKSEIIDWIKTDRQQTLKELEAEAEVYFLNSKKGGRYEY
ncbi:helix-turn-helix domain-containing protein [Aestuariibaculum sp. M13]|uniref:helix-turn-helix domain-containing protein n=1 Tax=Aestuariibaculum sp. M13 TaxID=2967132 RepID=UPI002159FC07|nr:helix-turn-helix domain-containing protein [Aestuariibaculum sp. M13]MCR8667896.1 helix-turn-helix domain-containing protein [Aestuariibaculum sp. M13]